MRSPRFPSLVAVLALAACSPREPVFYPAHPTVTYASPSPATTAAPQPDSPAPSGQHTAVPAVRTATVDAREPVPAATTREPDLRTRYKGRRAKRVLVGSATYYHDDLAGNRTASGARYDPLAFTAAHRTLPFGTVLRVVRVSNGQDVFVRVNDRGPFGRKRVILDLSRAAAERIGLDRAGIAKVRIEVLELGSSAATRSK